MQKKIKRSFIFLGLFSIFFLWANFALAFEVQYPTVFGLSIGNGTLPEYARYFFNIGMAVAGILAVCITAFGGAYYLVSFGRGKFTNEGKDWIKAGIYGMLLIFCSYLIASTINPALVIFNLNGLVAINNVANYFNNTPSGPPVETYNEIPIGTLTENLLSRTMDCYDFDGNGDPINGSQITTDDNKKITGPTYLNHDRVDCFLKLSQAVEKKAQTIKNLSDEITKLMNQCACGGSFSATGSGSSTTTGPVYTPGGVTCTNAICGKGKPDSNGQTPDCKYPNAPKCPSDTIAKSCVGSTKPCNDTCSNKGCSGSGNCCPADVKQKTEHGPIAINDCQGLETDYKGLDEFRSQFAGNYNAIKQKVEIQPSPKVNGKQISVIISGNCQACDYQCQTCNPNDSNCVAKQQKCNQDQQDCLKNRKKCLQQNSPWYSLRLIDQLIYLKGKIDEIKPKVKTDLDNLKSAETSLGKCYLADSYIDFVKTYQQTNQQNKTILVQRTFSDPDTQQTIIPAKYCQGFQYNNSSCYSQCQKSCPASADDIKHFASCPTCDPKDASCLKDQNDCIKNWQEQQKCIFGDTSSDFQGCMDSCKQQCLNGCNSICSTADKNTCISKCNGNSTCLLNNENKCLFSVQSLKDCVKNSSDDNSLKNCSDSAGLCTYCSDQYAGYPECLKSPYSEQGIYSSSFIFQNPSYQICPNPYKAAVNNTSSSQDINTVNNCLNSYPETAKCPASSKCPTCPCDNIDETVNYLPQPTLPQASKDSCSLGSSTTSTTPKTQSGSSLKIKEAGVCSGNCDNSSYNDDPLTFYCSQTWLRKDETKDTTPIGNSRICPKEEEVPVGQTVDGAEKWAQSFMDNIDKFSQKTQEMIQYINKIGADPEQNHCQCGSKCEGGEPVCQAKCTFQYTPASTTSQTYPNGSTTSVNVPAKCVCSRQGCSGNPCQKMINWMQGKTAGQECSTGIADPGIAYYAWQIDNGVKDFIIFTTQDARSETIKELSYSRKQTNSCSVTQNNYGIQSRLLSCTRVENEIISPIVEPDSKTIIGNKDFKSYCYGQALGAVLKTSSPMADNWFCCEERGEQAKK